MRGRNLFLRVAITAVVCLAFSGGGWGQAVTSHLYFVSGFPASVYDISMSTRLYGLDRTGKLVLVSTLTPESPDTIRFNYDDESAWVTGWPDKTVNLEFPVAGHVAITQKLPELFPYDHAELACKPIHTDGAFGVAVEWSHNYAVESSSDRLALPASLTERGFCNIDLPLPDDMQGAQRTPMFLQVFTNHLAVLESNNERKVLADGLGFRLAHVLDRSTDKWRTIKVPGSVSWCRAFGNWVAYVVVEGASPESKARKLDGQPLNINRDLGISVDQILDETGRYFPGTLFIYNVSSTRSYTVRTGERDTEPLLVSGNLLYFRVNSSIYSVELGDKSMVDLSASHLIVSDERLTNVHWALPGSE